MKLIILTQETCPRCDTLKMFLKAAMKDVYKNDITYVKKEDDEFLFNQYVKSTGTTQTPTLVFEEDSKVVEVLQGFNPAKTKKALETHLHG